MKTKRRPKLSNRSRSWRAMCILEGRTEGVRKIITKQLNGTLALHGFRKLKGKLV